MQKRKGLYQQRGYHAFTIAATLHADLFPGESCDGGSRRMVAIYRAMDKSYTDGIEDALQMSDAELARERRKILTPDRDM